MIALVLPLPGGELGGLELHRFPDGEVRVRIAGAAAGRTVILVGSLDRPDGKILPLLFAAATARDLGAWCPRRRPAADQGFFCSLAGRRSRLMAHT